MQGTIPRAISDIWLRRCVQVLECEQPTLKENLRRKYKGDKTVHNHVCLRMLMFFINRQMY